MKSFPRWIKVVAGIALATKLIDALVLLTYPIALIPSMTSNVDTIYLAHRIVSTDIALSIILIIALLKRSPLILGAVLLALIANEGLDSVTLFMNYLDGNLEARALPGAFVALIFAIFYYRAGSQLLKQK